MLDCVAVLSDTEQVLIKRITRSPWQVVAIFHPGRVFKTSSLIVDSV